MICLFCHAGGALNQRARYAEAEDLHSRCKEGCDCQHKTGPDHLNKELLGELSRPSGSYRRSDEVEAGTDPQSPAPAPDHGADQV